MATAATERSCIRCRIPQDLDNPELAAQLSVPPWFMVTQNCVFEQLKLRLHLTS